MRRIFIASLFVFAFCLREFGQNPTCPTISVTGPATAEELKEPQKFTATVTGIDKSKIRYAWTVSEGEIIQGQGTDTIFVRTNQKSIYEAYTTATVDLEGLPEGCQSSDSETGIIIERPVIYEVDSFEITATPVKAETLDALISELEKYASATVSIIIYSKGKSPSKPVREKEAFIKKYLSDKKIADDRINIVDVPEDDADRVRIFIVPEGANMPEP